MSEVSKTEQIRTELEEVRKLSEDRLLHPEKAVAWARQNKDSALYSSLEWNDAEAAEQYRIEQVRQLIRVVVIPSTETGRKIRAYISHPSDRVNDGGYRRVEESLALARQELVAEAIKTVCTLRNRYTHLPELDEMFFEIEKIARNQLIEKRQAS